MAVVALRPVEDGDLDALFEQMRDPEGVRMAAFTPEDPDDRNAFDAHMARVRSSPDITLRAVTCDGRLAGSIASFPAGGQLEVTYWIDRAAWGKGQFRGGSHHQWPPRWPVLEVGDRMVGEIGPQHVSHCFRVEQAARRD